MSPKFFLSILATFFLAGSAEAQYSLNFQTNSINAVTSNWVGNGTYVIGSNTYDDALIVTNGGRLLDGTGYLGYTATSSNNTALITGSVWSNSANLYVGFSGTGNTVTITNNSTLIDANGYIGNGPSANSNAVTVTGTGSSWTNATGFVLGYYGSFNTLTIANGAQVYAPGSQMGYQSNANSNAVTVTGAGSVWNNNGGTLNVGASGYGNTLTITNGGAVSDGSANIGLNSNGANGNAVTVTGAGSVWNNNGGTLTVGNSGSFNTLTIANGGIVSNGVGYIGYNSGANNNAVTVTGVGSVWNNSGDLSVGNSGNSNTLTIANGGAVSNANGWIGYNSGANNTVIVTGIGSIWNNSIDLTVGYGGIGNTLTISNGAAVFNNGYGLLGFISSNNSVTVTGPGSVWNNNGTLLVGYGQSSNTLTVANGGAVYSSGGYIGSGFDYDTPGANSNTVTITGAGSVWNNSGSLFVGYTTDYGNTLTIANGGAVSSSYGYIGYNAGANNNSVTVTGTGSVWNNSIDLTVGYGGIGNTLTISNGGAVFNNGYGLLGFASSNNSVTVTGPGSVWNNNGTLLVGYGQSSNTLTVANGGAVYSSGGYIGSGFDYDTPGASSNTVTITGAGSVWNNSGNLYVGYTTDYGNTLTIANDGAVSNSYGYIGYNAGANNNSVTVTGTGSVWNNSGMIAVSLSPGSSNNTLTISSSGLVVASNVSIASNANSSGSVTVNSGGELSLNGGVYLGPGGTLTINGGTLGLWGNVSFSNQQAIAGGPGTVNFVSGDLLIEPTGVVSFGPSFTSFSGLTVVNQGVLQLQATAFTFGSGFDNQANFSVGSGQSVNVQNGLSNEGGLFVQPNGALVANAIINQSGSVYLENAAFLSVAAAWTNSGPISIQGGGISGGTIRNTDLIEGYGSVTAPLNNLAGGNVIASGGLLALNGTGNQNQNGASFEIESGATLVVNTALVNNGVINNQGGVFEVSNASLTNNGVLTGYGTFQAKLTVNNAQTQFQGGPANVYGTYVNSGGATTVVSSITADFFGAVTNNAGGYFKNTASQITFLNTFYNNGTYLSDPATNVFTATVALGPNGVLAGGNGNLFVMRGDLTSANPNGLQLDGGTLEFTSGAHNFTLAGTAYLGTLQVDSGGTLMFSGATLYVLEFDAALSQITTADTIYYDPTDNPALGGLTYILSGGGLLEAVPEPGTWLLVVYGIAALAWWRKKRA